jgi:hypothetical protein
MHQDYAWGWKMTVSQDTKTGLAPFFPERADKMVIRVTMPCCASYGRGQLAASRARRML